MGYVDGRSVKMRREGRHEDDSPRDELRFGEFMYDLRNNPYLSFAAGLGLAIPASWVSLLLAFFTYEPAALLLAPILMLPSAAFFLRGLYQLARWGGRERAGPKFGAEKQLLMTILYAGGSITPVEASLETSLTVDEAEEILSRLAERGHLFVESRDGALFYALPTRRDSTLEAHAAPGRVSRHPRHPGGA